MVQRGDRAHLALEALAAMSGIRSRGRRRIPTHDVRIDQFATNQLAIDELAADPECHLVLLVVSPRRQEA